MDLSAVAALVAIIFAAWTSLSLAVGLALGAAVRRRDAESLLLQAADVR